MPDPKDIFIWVIGLPVGVSLVAILLSQLPWRRDRAIRPWGPAFALAGAFAAAYIGLRRRLPMPPVDAQSWLVYLGITSAVLAVLTTAFARRRWKIVVFVASIALIAATVWLMWRSQIPLLGWRGFLVRMAGVAACMVAWWVMMDRLSARVTGPAIPLTLTATASVTALALVNNHSLFLGELAGAIAAGLGTLMVVSFLLRKLTLAGGGVLTLTVLLFGLLLVGRVYDLPTLDFLLLAIAPLAAWVGEIPVFRSKRPRFAARVVAVLIVLTIPLVPALKGLRQTMQEQTDSYTY